MMFGWSKREKNEKSQNKATAELKHLDAKAKGKKLSRLRKRYPNRLIASSFDFAYELFDYDLVILYLLLSDDMAVESADVFDNPDPKPEPGPGPEPEPKTGQDLVDMVEAAVVSDVVVAAEEVAPEVEETVSEATSETASFDSPPVESSPSVESSPETTSSNSGSNSGGYSGGGGYDSGSFDSGGGD